MSELLIRLPDILRQFGDRRAAETWTALPAKVKSYDTSTQTADLEIVVREPLVDDEDEADVEYAALPVIPNVRILFPSVAGFSITFPVPVGSEVLFVVSTLSLSEYRRTGKTSDAVDVRRHSLGSSGWALPGFLHDGALLAPASTNAMVLEGAEVRIGANAVDPIVKEPPLSTFITQLLAALAGATAAGGGASVVYTPALPSAPSIAAAKGRVE